MIEHYNSPCMSLHYHLPSPSRSERVCVRGTGSGHGGRSSLSYTRTLTVPLSPSLSTMTLTLTPTADPEPLRNPVRECVPYIQLSIYLHVHYLQCIYSTYTSSTIIYKCDMYILQSIYMYYLQCIIISTLTLSPKYLHVHVHYLSTTYLHVQCICM